jgi:hypothetical protein
VIRTHLEICVLCIPRDIHVSSASVLSTLDATGRPAPSLVDASAGRPRSEHHAAVPGPRDHRAASRLPGVPLQCSTQFRTSPNQYYASPHHGPPPPTHYMMCYFAGERSMGVGCCPARLPHHTGRGPGERHRLDGLTGPVVLANRGCVDGGHARYVWEDRLLVSGGRVLSQRYELGSTRAGD